MCLSFIYLFFFFFRHVSKENLWLSFLSHASNYSSSSDHLDGKHVKKKNNTHNATECFPIKTLDGIQCYRDLNFEIISPKSTVIAITLSPYKVNYIATLLRI